VDSRFNLTLFWTLLMLPIDTLYRGRQINPDGIALEDDTTQLTYRELITRVEALAAALQSRLPHKQAKVAACGYNNLQHVIAILATHLAGHIWVAVNPRSGKAENNALMDLVEPEMVIADDAARDAFDIGDTPFILAAPDGGKNNPAEDTVDGLIEAFRGKRPTRPLLDPNTDIQAIKFTGGSTGLPKAVMQPYRTGITLIGNFLSVFRLNPDDCQLAAAPVSHAAFILMLPIFAVGGRNIVLPAPDPDRILHSFEHRGVSTIFMPPTLIYKTMAEPNIEQRSFPNLRHLLYSAAPMPPEKVRQAQAIFPGAVETIYGQTEASSLCTAMTSVELAHDANNGSVGRATPLMRVEIMDPEGNILPPGETGEVVVRGGLTMTGYYKNPDATQAAFRDGWLLTGDGGLIDERGYLFLKDRLRDVIITGGFNVYPTDVEGALVRHPDIYECVVFGASDDHWGERVEAAVQLRDGATASADDIIAHAKDQLGSVKAPKAVHLVDDLPRSAVGKVLRREIRERFSTPSD
jgi:acyl-CoA synthetase (AMP-forming)/AMP-acid ligase II